MVKIINEGAESREEMEMIKTIYPNIISDHNSEGFDSVDSQDFDPGYGCVPVRQKRETPLPPPMIREPLNEAEQWRYEEEKRSEGESNAMQDEYLKSRNI